jgi:hypothetical protein
MTDNARPRGRRIAGRAALGALAAPMAILAVAGPASAAGLGFNGALDDDHPSNKADLTIDLLNDGSLDTLGLGGLGDTSDVTGLLDGAGGVASATDLLGLAGGGLGSGLSVTDDLDSASAPVDLGVARVNLDNVTKRPLASLDAPGDLLGLGSATGLGDPLDALGGGQVKNNKLDAAVAVDLDQSNNKVETKTSKKDDDSKKDDSSKKDADSEDGTDVTDAIDADTLPAPSGALTGGDIVSSTLGSLGGLSSVGGGSLGGLF